MKPVPDVAPSRGPATRDQVSRQVAGVDVIEVKATIPETQVDGALARYNLTLSNDDERLIYFFDTLSFDLLKSGVIARARMTKHGQTDSTVKFRPVVPEVVSKDWAKFGGFKLEADASEKGVVRSASLTMPVEKARMTRFDAKSGKGIGVLFAKEQEKFLRDLGSRIVDFDALAVHGPLQAHRWQFEQPECPWKITAELWLRKDGARLLEVSIKTPSVQAAVAIAGFMAFLAEVGAEQNMQAQSKTSWAMSQPTDELSAGQISVPSSASRHV
jgi:hypothetical protein